MKKQIPVSKLEEITRRTSMASTGLVALILLACCWVMPVRSDIVGLQRVASGLTNPIYVTHAPGDTSRLFLVQRGGAIRILNFSSGVLQPIPFLTIPNVSTSGEGGLLGLAFHPGYQTNGKFYVNVTLDDAVAGTPFSTYVREYTVSENPNVANPASARQILSFPQPQNNNNGGWIGFSPNNHLLYVASGDGGGSYDTGSGHTAGTGNAQDITSNPLGKILRVDVNGDDFPTDASRNYAIPPSNPFVGATGDDEIFAYGLRNPFRAGFDRATGDLWIGDVGHSSREEIDFLPASSAGGENYGWRLREGTIATPGVGGARPPGNVDPVYDYDRNADAFGGTVVIGGYVYRGPDPALRGKYFFLDSRSSASAADDNYWIFDPADPYGTVQNIDNLLTPNVGSPMFPVSFGEDEMGNLYIAYIVSGDVYRIQTTIPAAPRLDIRRNGNRAVVLSWGTNFTGFTLEANRNLNMSVWNVASPAPAVRGTNYVVTNTVSGSARFYRLRR